MKKNYLFFVPVFVTMICACGESTKNNLEPDQHKIQTDTSTTAIESIEPLAVEAPDVYETTDTNQVAQLLNATTYHNDEVPEDVDQQNWMGLFADKPHFFLEETTVQAKHVYDAVLDEDESVKTGWEISVAHPEVPVVLIKGVQLEQGEVIRTHLDANELLPGDTVKFVLEGKSFELFASGNEVSYGDYISYENYKLFLRGEKNGKTITQLLVAQDNFDDDMIDILFAGDLDRDHFPDFLIDNAYHYNMTSPTLYLSSGVASGKLVEIVGWHISVGC